MTEEENLQTYSLVWLDATVDSNEEKLTIQKKLRATIDDLRAFSNENLCENYLLSTDDNQRIFVIISGQLGKDLIHHIHHFKQISLIYVFCIDKTKYQSWANQYPKIKCVINRSEELINQISYDYTRRNQNKVDEPFSYLIYNENDPYNEFICSQLLINSLLEMKILIKNKLEFLAYLKDHFRQNEEYLLTIKEFERDYSPLKSLLWLTKNTFLTSIFNKALRNDNFYLLFLLRFFLQDIYRQIQSNRITKPIRVYKSQILSHEQLTDLKNSLGKLISIRSFLISNLNKKQAFSHLKEYFLNQSDQAVLFEINANPTLLGIRSFVNLRFFSMETGEQQILFMPNSLFRIEKISYLEKFKMTIVELTLASNREKEFERNAELEQMDLFSYGELLMEKKDFPRAEIYFRHLIDHLPFKHQSISQCFYSLGQIYSQLNQLKSSLKAFEKCLEMQKHQFASAKHPQLASTHNQIALIHLKENHYQQALESYQQALQIFQEHSSEDNIHIVDSLNHIAMIHKYENNYQLALEFYQKILAIQEKTLRANHPDLGMTHMNIALAHSNLQQYQLALEHLNQALLIYEQLLPKQHCLISMIYENIGNIYYDQKEFDQGLEYYQKADDIYQSLLPKGHPDVLQIAMIIKRIQSKIKYL